MFIIGGSLTHKIRKMSLFLLVVLVLYTVMHTRSMRYSSTILPDLQPGSPASSLFLTYIFAQCELTEFTSSCSQCNLGTPTSLVGNVTRHQTVPRQILSVYLYLISLTFSPGYPRLPLSPLIPGNPTSPVSPGRPGLPEFPGSPYAVMLHDKTCLLLIYRVSTFAPS